jgi:hypothetical protein
MMSASRIPADAAWVGGVIARRGAAVVRCAGASMQPTVRVGERVLVARCEHVRRGEVALIATGAGLVLHRVAARLPLPGAPPLLLHAGDACPFALGVTTDARVLGRAVVERRAPTLGTAARSLAVLVISLGRLAHLCALRAWRRARGAAT